MANQDRGPLQAKRGSAADWAVTTVPLLPGEWGYDETSGVAKIGNGSSLWGDLPVPAGVSYDPVTGLFSAGGGDPIPSVDPDTLLLPPTVLAALDRHNDDRRANRPAVDTSYRKRIVHNLVYQHADAAAALATYGTGLYPQAFVIDPVADEILTISGPPQIVSVYSWSTGAYKGVIYSLGRTGVSESADIRYIGGKRYLYTVDVSGKAGSVVRFDITNQPAKLSTLTPDATYTADVLNSIHWRNGHWVSTSFAPAAGPNTAYRSRGRLSFFDETFTQTGMADFPVTQTGGAAQYQAASMPKMQGFDEGPGYFIFGCGGGTAGASTLTPYHYQGVRMFTPGGGLIVDSLLYADKMLAILNANGCNGNIIENEGVQIVDGKVYTLFPINSGASAGSTTGGIVVMEEFSAHKDAIDFSSAATTWAMPDAKRIQSGSYPVSADGVLRNLVTWEPMTSLAAICSYMQAVGQDRVAFYSTDVSVTDGAGATIPAGYFVEVVNRNFASYLVTVTGSGTTRKRLMSYDGTNWTQSNYPEWTTFTPVSPLVDLAATNPNQVAMDGSMVIFKFGVRLSSGQLPAGTNVILNAGTLAERFRPQWSENFLVAGQTSGPGMRLSVDSTGLVQLVGVPATTHNYATGTVQWPARADRY